MRLPRRDQLALVVLALVCALLAWRVHDRGLWRSVPQGAPATTALPSTPKQPLLVTSTPALGSPVSSSPRWVPITSLPPGVASRFRDAEVTNRLRNTDAPLGELMRSDTALLLRNALIDTASGEPLGVPASLRSSGLSEAWLVQARGVITPTFRAELTRVGATVLSYVPNNALLVRASGEAADQLANSKETAAILPLEPYFKLTPHLLALALAEEPLPPGQRLVLTIPEASRDLPELAATGAREVTRERGPFGTLVTVEAPRNALVALAGLPSVHRIEPAQQVALANDLTAYSIGSTLLPDNSESFDGLTGENVLVNVNDTGVDASHPDLTNRVYTLPTEPQFLTDPQGHGTHVAGTIAGNGSQSDTINQIPGGPPSGSVTNANFKGKAPAASIYILPVDLLFGPASGDSFLQETAARAPQRFNAPEDVLISNNSWGYVGFDEYEYSSHSASYDSAVRDALPERPGDQPIMYVFSAGNSGLGGNNGVGGIPGTIVSPGNAKNVITVGALESFRELTNAIVYDTNAEPVQIGGLTVKPGWETNSGPYFTNRVLLPMTDTDWQVAFYSSRGNVGIGTEGTIGRFKPDVVAGGSFIISTRSAQWSPEPLPDPSDPFFPFAVLFDEVNLQALPEYRYESGTSMAAPAISGMLAQLQQYFEQRANQYPSAAAYKALLINSARPTSPGYVPSQDSVMNYAGWGKPNLQRALGRGFRATVGGQNVDVIGLDAASGVATGESLDLTLRVVATNAVDVPLRLALVWTDPPGDPLVGPKLVNDLNLIVSNTVTGDIYWGNDFNPETGFSRAHPTNEIATNGITTLDRINNVERLILPPPLASNYVVTVVGYRVNVNSRRDAATQIVQDFALAFSSDIDPAEAKAIGILDVPPAFNPIALSYFRPPTGVITNSLPLLNERAGANSPLVDGTNGFFKQWRFYSFTNLPGTASYLDVVSTNGSNVLFVTFPVGSLSRGRTNGPDVDLYVSRDPRLMNLNPDAVAAADKSTTRGGSELLYYLNQPLSADNIFYVGVKSEDHEGGEYGFIGISTDQPLLGSDGQGNPQPITIPLGRAIPDGTPANPGLETYLAVSILPNQIRGAFASVTKTHDNFPDLVSQLSLNGISTVLQNHTLLNGLEGGSNVVVSYDDTGSGQPGTIPSDGPGSLIDYLGLSGMGTWFLNTLDNALGNSGFVNNFTLTLVPNNFGEDWVDRCVEGGFISLEVINVPPEASRLTISIRNIDPAVPLEVFIRRDQFPDIFDPANNDKYAQIPATGGSVTIGIRDVPPLQAGRYFIAVFNPSLFRVCYQIRGQLERNLDSTFTRTFSTLDTGLIPDAARRFASITVDDGRPVTAMDVGLRINHTRLSDLSVRLQNPRGYSAVLFEERGGTNATELGNTVVSTNLRYQHVAMTFEPASHRAALYVNGASVAERFLPPEFKPVTSNQFLFALDPRYQFRNQTVQLDDFGIWRRALAPQEIRDIYLNGLDGEAKQPADRNNGLYALWPLNGNGNDLIGPNSFRPTHQVVPVPGAFPNELGLLFPSPGFGLVTNQLTMPRSGEFTLEGWVYIPPATSNAVIAGWWGDNTVGFFGPGLVSDSNIGRRSITGVLTDASGEQVYLSSAAGVLTQGLLTTNTLFATFSENTNRSSEKIKFVPPPFQGQVVDEQLLSLDNFDQSTNKTYPAGESFNGWNVISNSVAVDQDGTIAYSGLNYLAVSNGVVRRTFNVVVGNRYNISFLARLDPEETNNITSNVTVLIDGVAVTPPPVMADPALWTTNTYDIRATKATVTLEFSSLATPTNSPGLLVDNVAFSQIGGSVTYLSEEPINPLMGAGQGTWLLELDDNRTPYAGDLLGWQLTLTFAPTSAPAIRLTNGVPYTGTVTFGEPKYFYIDVPLEASTSTNLLRSINGPPLGLWYNPLGIPGEGTLPEDAPLIFPTTGTNFLFAVLNTNLPPRLVPGQRYYLSVEDLVPATTNPFTVQVDLGIKITPLTNEIPVMAISANNGLFDYYSFNVSSNAIGVSFVLTNLADNLQLVARKGPQLPTRTQFDYASTNTGTQPEVITITLTDQPVPLSPGIWYLGVYSASVTTNPIPYTIVAVESVGNVISLTNGVPYTGTITNNNETAYFVLDIIPEPLVASFTLTNLSENVSMYLRKGLPLPSPFLYDYSSVNDGTAVEEIILAPGSQPVRLSPGQWYVAVVPEVPAPIDFTIIGSFVPNTLTIIPLTNGIPYTFANALAIDNAYFSFEAPPDVGALLFEIYALTGDATLRASYGVLPSYAAATNIFSFPQPGSLSERISVRTNQMPSLAGPWYLEVSIIAPDALDFTIRAVTQKDGLLLSDAPFQGTYLDAVPPRLVFDTVPGEHYRISYADDLRLPLDQWTPVQDPPGSGNTLVTAPGDTLEVELPPAPEGNEQRYYRIEQVPQ